MYIYIYIHTLSTRYLRDVYIYMSTRYLHYVYTYDVHDISPMSTYIYIYIYMCIWTCEYTHVFLCIYDDTECDICTCKSFMCVYVVMNLISDLYMPKCKQFPQIHVTTHVLHERGPWFSASNEMYQGHPPWSTLHRVDRSGDIVGFWVGWWCLVPPCSQGRDGLVQSYPVFSNPQCKQYI